MKNYDAVQYRNLKSSALILPIFLLMLVSGCSKNSASTEPLVVTDTTANIHGLAPYSTRGNVSELEQYIDAEFNVYAKIARGGNVLEEITSLMHHTAYSYHLAVKVEPNLLVPFDQNTRNSSMLEPKKRSIILFAGAGRSHSSITYAVDSLPLLWPTRLGSLFWMKFISATRGNTYYERSGNVLTASNSTGVKSRIAQLVNLAGFVQQSVIQL